MSAWNQDLLWKVRVDEEAKLMGIEAGGEWSNGCFVGDRDKMQRILDIEDAKKKRIQRRKRRDMIPKHESVDARIKKLEARLGDEERRRERLEQAIELLTEASKIDSSAAAAAAMGRGRPSARSREQKLAMWTARGVTGRASKTARDDELAQALLREGSRTRRVGARRIRTRQEEVDAIKRDFEKRRGARRNSGSRRR
jgi:hypothetical protein